MGSFEFGSQFNPSAIESHLPVYEDYVFIYPNPAKNIMHVKVQDLDKIEIYNQLGQLVLESQSRLTDISILRSGIYIVKIYSKALLMNYNLKLIKE